MKFNLHTPLGSVYSRNYKDIKFEVKDGVLTKENEQDELPKEIEDFAIRIAQGETRERIRCVMAMPTEFGTLIWGE